LGFLAGFLIIITYEELEIFLKIWTKNLAENNEALLI